MSTPSAHEIIDPVTLDRIVEVLQLRNAADPDEDRAAALEQLRKIRNMITHGYSLLAYDETEYPAALAMYAALIALEATSLGTATARRVRAQATAARVARILERSEEEDL